MTLPHPNITRIPDNEPDAVPSLWNTRYDEIDQNFQNLDGRVGNLESEVSAARGDKSSLDIRLDEIEQNLEGLDPDMQNALVSLVKKTLDSASLANREIEKTLQVRVQKGEIFIANRGVISGLSVSKSTNATRNINVSAGQFFMYGQRWSIGDMSNTAAVPSNNSSIQAVCYVFLWIDNNEIKIDCTNLNEDVPEYGLPLAQLIVPANNNEITDPYLNNVTIIDIRRIEPNWPLILQSPASKYIPIQYPLLKSDYSLRFEIVEYQGPKPDLDSLIVESKAGNGFNIVVSCIADSLKINYLIVQNTI